MLQGQQVPPGKTWTMKTFLLMQMRIPQGRDRIPRDHHRTGRHQGRPSQERNNQRMDNPKEQRRHPEFHWILQLLSEIHQGIQQNRKAIIQTHRKQGTMGLGKGTARGFRQVERMPDNGTDPETLRPRQIHLHRKRCIKIRMRRNIIPTGRKREIIASGIPIKENDASRMQL